NLETYAGATFDVYWGDTNQNPNDDNDVAAIVVSVVYSDNAGTNYGLGKATFDPNERNNNFGKLLSSSFVYPAPGGLKLQDDSVRNDYAHKATVNLTSTDSSLPPRLIPSNNPAHRPVLARIRLLYAGPKQIAIAPAVGANL